MCEYCYKFKCVSEGLCIDECSEIQCEFQCDYEFCKYQSDCENEEERLYKQDNERRKILR